jgi:DNA polymerase III subunit gamma/tau
MNKKQTLARSLRPKSFKNIFGQDHIIQAIRNQFNSGRLPQSIIARSINCVHKTGKHFGEYCQECQLRMKKNLNFQELNAARYRTVEDASQIAVTSEYRPIKPDKYRVLVVDEPHSFSKEGQRLLLKYIEEPPPTTIWIFCTTDAHKLIYPLRTRFVTYQLKSLFHKDAEAFITWAAKEANITRDLPEFFEFVHKNQVSSARVLLNALEKYASGIDPDKALDSSESSVNALRIFKGLIAGEWNNIRPELEKASVEEVRLIKASLLGLLRSNLLSRTPTIQRRKLTLAIDSLVAIPNMIETSEQFTMLCSKLYTICEKVF